MERTDRITKADVNFMIKLIKHLETVFDEFPNMPNTVSNKCYNAYRLLRREDTPRLKRKILKWSKG